MTTDTNKTETATKHNNYPFTTKKEIACRLASDETFTLDCLVILYQRQTVDEADTSTTKYKNAKGFMSSHAVHGTRLAKAVLAGEELSDEDFAKVAAIVPRYTKQLADHFRQEAIKSQPELASAAAAYFKPQA